MGSEVQSSVAELVAAEMLRNDRATAMLGIRLVSVAAGKACVKMQVCQQLLNGHGTCHGGVLFSLADTAFGLACNSRNERTVSASGQIEYLQPVLSGDVLVAHAEERLAGRRLGVYDVTVTNQEGKTVALFRGRSCRVDGSIVAGVSTNQAAGK